MEFSDIQKRAIDLQARSEKLAIVTATHFLNPAEQRELRALPELRERVYLFGGNKECERRIGFFLPYYLDAESLDSDEYISALELKAGFGTPGHRDYLGALMGLGIDRSRIGDIFIKDDTAILFCEPEIAGFIKDNLDKVGRYGVKIREIPLSEARPPEIQKIPITFTVSSMRLDAVVAGCFKLSRGSAAERIKEGLVSHNSIQALKPDARVQEGDIISLRGTGKAQIDRIGGKSRKDRDFITALVYK